MKKFIKFVYGIIPFKKKLFSVLKFFWTPNENIHKHLYFKGKIKLKINKSKSFKMIHYGFQLENELFWQGVNGWERESSKIWMQLCEKSDVIVDIGANTGIYAIIAKTINPNSTIYAFEPVKRVFNKLEKNININNYNITAIEKAVSNCDGSAIIYDNMAEHIYSVTVNKNLLSPNTKAEKVNIETITLNSFIKQYGLTKIDLMKIDVETHEPEVLDGFSEYIEKFKPTMLIEILNDEVGEKVNRIVENLGYRYYNIDEKKGLTRLDKIIKSYSFNYLLCSDKTAKYLGLD